MSWNWKWPEGMTLKDLRRFVIQCEGVEGEDLIRVETRGAKVIDMRIEHAG